MPASHRQHPLDMQCGLSSPDRGGCCASCHVSDGSRGCRAGLGEGLSGPRRRAPGVASVRVGPHLPSPPTVNETRGDAPSETGDIDQPAERRPGPSGAPETAATARHRHVLGVRPVPWPCLPAVVCWEERESAWFQLSGKEESDWCRRSRRVRSALCL